MHYIRAGFQIIALGVASVYSCALQAADSHAHADTRAPIGVMGEHMHHQGDWMLSYRYMEMRMHGNRNGMTRLDSDEVRRPTGEYGVAPLSMDMRMHMLGVMVAPGDDWSLMLMLPFLNISMDHQTAMPMPNGMQFTTQSSGIGDIQLSSLYRLNSSHHSTWILNVGVSLPTGSIEEEDFLPPVNAVGQMPFPMQLGSGTTDLLPGLTYTAIHDVYSWGAQFKATIRTGENDQGYTLGDRMLFSVWAVKSFTQRYSASLRVSYEDWDDIDGVDAGGAIPLQNGMGLTVPTVDPDLRAGTRLDIALGFNITFPSEQGRHRLALEMVKPIEQDLDGPQLETDSVLNVGWQYSF